MAGLFIADPIVRAKLVRISDGLLAAVAVSLPWSTTATGILLVLWLLTLFPTLEWSDVRRELMTPAGSLPVLLFLLGVLGMAWAGVPLLERWKGLTGFFKLLVIPLLMAQFRRSDNGTSIFIGFLIACVALLTASWIVVIRPALRKAPFLLGVALTGYFEQSLRLMLGQPGWFSIHAAAPTGAGWPRPSI